MIEMLAENKNKQFVAPDVEQTKIPGPEPLLASAERGGGGGRRPSQEQARRTAPPGSAAQEKRRGLGGQRSQPGSAAPKTVRGLRGAREPLPFAGSPSGLTWGEGGGEV